MKNIIIIIFFLIALFSGFNLYAQDDIQKGIKLIRSEKYTEATKHFSSLLSSKNKAEANFYLGQIYFLKGNIDSAKMFYSQGIKADVDFPLNYAGMVKVNTLQNNQADADKYLEQALDISKGKDPKTLVVLSEAYSNQKVKNYEKSLDLLNSYSNEKLKSADIYINLGKAYLGKIKGTEAVNSFEKALNIEEKNPEALTMKAKVYKLINISNEAITLLNKAVESDSTYSPAYYELAELYADLKDYSKATMYFKKYIDSSEPTPDKLKRYASILYVNKDYTKTIEILEKLVKTESEKASSFRILAYSYLKLEDNEKSKFYFDKLFKLTNVDYSSSDFENYSDLLTKTGNDSLAIEYLTKLAAIDSLKKDDAFGKISVLSFKNKNWEGVVNSLTKKKNLTAQEYFDLSKAYIFIGEKTIVDNIASLKKNINLSDEQSGKIRQALLYYQKDFTEAKSDEQKITVALNKLAQSVETELSANQKSNWVSSQSQWLQTVRSTVKDNFAKADTTLGSLIVKAPTLAIAYIWRARVKTNFDPESVAGLAKPYYEKFIELAVKDFEKYKKELIESYSYLGYYYYLQKDNQVSKRFWQEVLNLDPTNKQAIDVIKMLK